MKAKPKAENWSHSSKRLIKLTRALLVTATALYLLNILARGLTALAINSITPYAEESTLLMQGLEYPFWQTLLLRDYGYSTAPAHALWRLLAIANKGHLENIIVQIRLIGPLLAIYCTLRSYNILGEVERSTLSAKRIFLAWCIVMYLANLESLCISFQFPYLLMPLASALLARSAYKPKVGLHEPKDKRKGNKRRNWLDRYARIFMRVVDYLLIAVSLLAKPIIGTVSTCYLVSVCKNLVYSAKDHRKRKETIRSLAVVAILTSALLLNLHIIVAGHDIGGNEGVNILKEASRNGSFNTETLTDIARRLTANLGMSLVLLLPIITYLTVFRTQGLWLLDRRAKACIHRGWRRKFPFKLIMIVPWIINLLMISVTSNNHEPWSFKLMGSVSPLALYIAIELAQAECFKKGLLEKRLRVLLGILLVIGWRDLPRMLGGKPRIIESQFENANYLSVNSRNIVESYQSGDHKCYFPGPWMWNAPYTLSSSETCLLISGSLTKKKGGQQNTLVDSNGLIHSINFLEGKEIVFDSLVYAANPLTEDSSLRLVTRKELRKEEGYNVDIVSDVRCRNWSSSERVGKVVQIQLMTPGNKTIIGGKSFRLIKCPTEIR